MAQAKCKECGMIYTFEGETIAPITKCVCQNTEFEKVIAVA